MKKKILIREGGIVSNHRRIFSEDWSNKSDLTKNDLVVSAFTENDISKINAERTEDERISNIDEKTLAEIKKKANESGVSIILRPVNETAYLWIKSGARGKNMAVHGKSSEELLLRGLIPVQASISKAGKNDDPQKIRGANEENKESLIISKRLIEQMKKKRELVQTLEERIVTSAPLHTKTGKQIYIFENNENLALRDSNSKAAHFFIKESASFCRINENHEIVSKKEGLSHEFHPVAVEVMVKPEINKAGDIKGIQPITADIDVLAYGHEIKDVGYSGINLSRVYPKMEGVASPVVKQFFKELNKSIGRDLITHSSEQFNISYTQPLDGKWIVVTPYGTIKEIVGEKNLIKEFNDYVPRHSFGPAGTLQNISFTPNPCWGWKKQGGKYVIDKNLKSLFVKVDAIKSKVDAIGNANLKKELKTLQCCKVRTGLAYLEEPYMLGRRVFSEARYASSWESKLKGMIDALEEKVKKAHEKLNKSDVLVLKDPKSKLRLNNLRRIRSSNNSLLPNAQNDSMTKKTDKEVNSPHINYRNIPNNSPIDTVKNKDKDLRSDSKKKRYNNAITFTEKFSNKALKIIEEIIAAKESGKLLSNVSHTNKDRNKDRIFSLNKSKKNRGWGL